MIALFAVRPVSLSSCELLIDAPGARLIGDARDRR